MPLIKKILFTTAFAMALFAIICGYFSIKISDDVAAFSYDMISETAETLQTDADRETNLSNVLQKTYEIQLRYAREYSDFAYSLKTIMVISFILFVLFSFATCIADSIHSKKNKETVMHEQIEAHGE